jgi:hypothetical protein
VWRREAEYRLNGSVSEIIFRRKRISDTCLACHCEGAERLWQSQGLGIHSAYEIATSACGLLAMTLSKAQVSEIISCK